MKLIAFLLALFCLTCTLEANPKPNILVIFADDLGYADLGAQGQVKDIRTPNLDQLAAEGVRCTAGYVTAPQCSPSRAGLITGRYQQRFGVDHIPDMPLPLEEVTIAERLKPAGYTSGMVGKWHLAPNALCRKWAAKNLPGARPNQTGRIAIPERQRQRFMPAAQGFDEYFCGEWKRYFANYDLQGRDLEPRWVSDNRFRVDVQTDAALAFLKRHHDQPFFLYLCYFAPHTPLELPKPYVEQFTGEMPRRRRAALAMIAGIDAGVGRILAALKRYGIEENTLIFFTSDNGAPIHRQRDTPLNTDMGGWDGSLNTPWVGEKGMLADGGIRVPFVVRWKGTLPAGQVDTHPVSTLDIAATANALAGLPADDRLDGINLIPGLTGQQPAPERALYWRFWHQTAIREGRWKLLRGTSGVEYLFDVANDARETRDRSRQRPEQVRRLRAKLEVWTRQLQPPGRPAGPFNHQEAGWYEEYFGASFVPR